MVVLHYTGMDSAEAAIARLCDPAAEVSAHYVITEDGTVLPLVDETLRAWHAGAGAWGAVTDVNSHSIGIEIVNPGPDGPAPTFPAAQMEALETLLGGIRARWAIPPERVIGHSDMAPGRKVDPGPLFDWRRLADAGHAVWTRPVSGGLADAAAFQVAVESFGFRVPEAGLPVVLEAFRLRFRPGQTGPLDGTDTATAQALAARWPCDMDIS